MTRYPLIAAAAFAVALAPALPAAAHHGPYCVTSPQGPIWCSPRTEDLDPLGRVCLNSTDEWCSPSVSEVLHGNPSTDMPGAICAYTHDGGWCSPAAEDYVEVTQFCVYPYDGGWCVPWVEVGS